MWLRFPLAILLTAGLQAGEMNYADNPARGLAIYKQFGSASDETAVLLEYMSYKVYDHVTYLVTPKGNRLTIPANSSELYLLPYPGKGEATPREAMAVIDVARKRFPRFDANLEPLKTAWKHEAARPANQVAAEIAARDRNNQASGDAIARIRNAPSALPSVTPPPSLLQPAAPQSSLASPTPAPAEAAPVSSPEPAETPSTDLDDNLQKLKQFYDLGKSLQNGDQ